MNWTGGKLQLHSKTNLNRCSKVRKKHFTGANSELTRNYDPRTSSFPLHPLVRKLRRQQAPTRRLFQKAVDAETGLFDGTEIEGGQRTSRLDNTSSEELQDGDSLEQVKVRLLSKGDWLGLSTSHPPVAFLPVPKIERIGRRRLRTVPSRTEEHNSPEHNIQSWSSRDTGRAFGTPQLYCAQTEAEPDHQVRLNHGSSLLDSQRLNQTSKSMDMSSDSMLLRPSKVRSDLDRENLAFRSPHMDVNTNTEGNIASGPSLLPLSQAKWLQSFDDMKECSREQLSRSGQRNNVSASQHNESRSSLPESVCDSTIDVLRIAELDGDDRLATGSGWPASILEKRANFTIDDQVQYEQHLLGWHCLQTSMDESSPDFVELDDLKSPQQIPVEFLSSKPAALMSRAVRATPGRDLSTEHTTHDSDTKSRSLRTTKVSLWTKPLNDGFRSQSLSDAETRHVMTDVQDYPARAGGEFRRLSSPSILLSSNRSSTGVQKVSEHETFQHPQAADFDLRGTQRTFRYAIPSSNSENKARCSDLAQKSDRVTVSHGVDRPSFARLGRSLDGFTTNTTKSETKGELEDALLHQLSPVTPRIRCEGVWTPMLYKGTQKGSSNHSEAPAFHFQLNTVQQRVPPPTAFGTTEEGTTFGDQAPANTQGSAEGIAALSSNGIPRPHLKRGNYLQSPLSTAPFSSSPDGRRMQDSLGDPRTQTRPKIVRLKRKLSSGIMHATVEGKDQMRRLLSPVVNPVFPASSFTYMQPS